MRFSSCTRELTRIASDHRAKTPVFPWFLLRNKSLQPHSTLVQLPTAPQESLCKWSASSGSDEYRGGVNARELEARFGAWTEKFCGR